MHLVRRELSVATVAIALAAIEGQARGQSSPETGPDETPSAPEPIAAPSTPSPSPSPPESARAPDTTPDEVRVRGGGGEADRLRRSADAVTVIDTRRAKQETADFGEVLARNQGISVRRSGGLGSATRFSLNGFQDDQVRFFLDGVPLDRAGYPFGVANVPVNAIERVEVFRGVVPVRLGADALGGAVNLVTAPPDTSHLASSYQVGSFGTYRFTASGRYHHEPSGIVLGGSAFVDSTRNDYPVDAEVTDVRGRTRPARVRRFHDSYRAYGLRLETGVVDRSWARKLLVQGFFSTYDKDLQNNPVMTVPYGEVTYGESVLGGTVRYEQPLASKVDLELVANYSHRTIDFIDEGLWVYDWFGRRLRQKRIGGEIGASPTNQTTWEDGGFGRALLKWAFAPDHELRVSSTASFSARTAEERRRAPELPDPFGGKRTLLTVVTGAEHQLDAFDQRLENVVFAKNYLYRATGDEYLAPNFVSRDRDELSFGVGDAARWRFGPSFWMKASYELATRMPRTDEVFGNGVLITPHLTIRPETSHNANVGPRVEVRKTAAGSFTVDVNGFLRSSEKLIVLLGNQQTFRYENVYGARAVGVESALTWASPGRWLSADGMLTWQDVRNVSNEGAFGAFDGDRIPNRPYLFASWGARVRVPDVGFRGSSVEPFYHGRWVHSFYRGWESQGLREYKQVVDAQITNDVGLSWIVERRPLSRLVSTLEVDNVGDARVYDLFGVQRPGRAVFFKVSGEI